MTGIRPPFQYSPLVEQDSIRLLVIQPGQPGSEVHCNLIYTTLSSCHDNIFDHYTALSYVWGDPIDNRVIFVNGTIFEVTKNLSDALENIRHEHQHLRLWADAICIDQSNYAERNIQVALMRQIYSFASFTIIYLGKPTTDYCDSLLAAMSLGSTKFDRNSRHTIATQILSRAWFTRVWTYQELVLSRTPWIQCGRRRVKWDALVAALSGPERNYLGSSSAHELMQAMNLGDESDSEGHDDAEKHRTIASSRTLFDMHAARNKRSPLGLLSILVSRRGFGVTDPRDFIYGHLAIAELEDENGSHRWLLVDYKRSAVDVFTDAARYMLHEWGSHVNTNVLLHVDSLKPRLQGLPSWVPDWSSTTGYTMTIPSFHVKQRDTQNFSPSVLRGHMYIEERDSHSMEGMLGAGGVQVTSTVRMFRVGTIGWVEGASDVASAVEEGLVRNIFDRFLSTASELRATSLFVIYGSTSFADDEITSIIKRWPSRLERGFPDITFGRKLGTVTNSSYFCLVPNHAETGDVIYALPVVESYQWYFLALRPVTVDPRQGLENDFSQIDDDSMAPGRYLQNDKQRHFTVVGCALVEESAMASWSLTRKETWDPTKPKLGHEITLH